MRVTVRYEPGLVERAVRCATCGSPERDAELHRLTDPLYDLPDTEARDAAFAAAHARIFERLDLDRTLPRLLDELPRIGASVASALVAPAARPAEETAELLVRGDGEAAKREDRRLLVQVTATTLADPERAARRLRPELLHVSDMVDPAFGYRRPRLEGSAAWCNLVRDRYRVLWEIYVQSRLERRGLGDGVTRAALHGQLARVFATGEEEVTGLLTRLLAAPALTHEELWTWALDDRLRDGAPQEAGPGAGRPCPLCGFSTFDWFRFERRAADRELARTIEARHPGWSPGEGACRQCAELHSLAMASH